MRSILAVTVGIVQRANSELLMTGWSRVNGVKYIWVDK